PPRYGGNYVCGAPGTRGGAGVRLYGSVASLGDLYAAECTCAGPVQCSQSIHADLDASFDALLEGAADAPDDAPADAPFESAEPEGSAPDASDDASPSPDAGGGDDSGVQGLPDAGCSTNACH